MSVMSGRDQSTETSSAFLVKLPANTKSIVELVRDSKLGLIKGLESVETRDGWLDPTAENAQSFWTSIEVLKSLVESGVYPTNYKSVLTSVKQTQKSINGLIGWEYEGIDDYISVYVTGDIIRLYVTLHKFDEIYDLIETLQRIQNEDGGWGVCNGDKSSKVRSTSWVLSVLLLCLNLEPIKHYVNQDVVAKGINWLYIAQNDSDGDFGWGNMPDILPSNVSATSFALDALIEAYRFYSSQTRRTGATPIKKDAIVRGLERLLIMNLRNFWQGVREEFAIKIDNKIIGRHVIGGAGATFVLQVLIKAIEAGLLAWPNDTVYLGFKNLTERCQPYSKYEGLWLVPADDGGAPLSWNSAYGIDALNKIESFFISHYVNKWMEKNLVENLSRNGKNWRRIAIALGIAILGIILAPFTKSIGRIPSWFAQLNVFYQGLIMMVVTLVFEQIYSRLFRAINQSKPSKSQVHTKGNFQ